MKPARPRYTRINSKVEQVLALAGVKEPPVPVTRIAELLGAKVVANDFKNEISGVLIRKDGKVIIGVSNDRLPHRQRFTVAHELGHLLLHEGEEVHVDRDFRINLRSPLSSKAEDVEEIEANAFAASLLMPIGFLMDDLRDRHIDVEDDRQVRELAERYGVSAQAMSFRLMNVPWLSKR